MSDPILYLSMLHGLGGVYVYSLLLMITMVLIMEKNKFIIILDPNSCAWYDASLPLYLPIGVLKAVVITISFKFFDIFYTIIANL